MTPLPDDSFPAHTLFETFQQVGLTRDRVRQLTFGDDNLRSPLLPTREGELSDESCAVLLRLFFCGLAETPENIADSLGLGLSASAVESGLLILEDNSIRSPLHLRYVRHLLLFSDYLHGREDEVMGAGETTAVLYGASRPQRRTGRVLDLGCGAGTLALLLAADAEYTIGTDINQRAVRMAQFNARLNNLQNVEFRVGDIFDPVAGERFNIIVSQPPYFPSSGTRQIFLHGGEHGDEIAREVCSGIPRYLTSIGRGVVFASWPVGRAPHFEPDLRVIELNANRLEVHGTRQSLHIIQSGNLSGGSLMSLDVPANCWDAIRPERIDEIYAAEELARQHDGTILNADLRLPSGLRFFDEEGQSFVTADPSTLLGVVPLSDEMKATLREWRKAPPSIVREALRRGLLVPRSKVEDPAS